MGKNAITYEKGVVYQRTIVDEVTADTNSNEIIIAGASGVGFAFTEGGTVNNREAVFSVDVSFDGGTTYVDYNLLIDNVVNTNVQNYTRVASKTRSSAGTDILWMDPNTLGPITHMKVNVDVTDGDSPTGNFTVITSIQYP